MSTTDKRVEELLERWLASVDRHVRYLQLDDAAYARAEDWPKHQRPNALVVNLARTRLLELKSHLSERRDAGDAKFAESLELMSFLTSLLGAEHIQRFIPLATGKPADTSISATIEQPRMRTHAARPASRKAAAADTPVSRSVAHKASPPRPSAALQAPTDTVSRQLVGARPRPAARAAPVAAPVPAAPEVVAEISAAMTRQVVSDAIRMLQWGREWPAVAGLIARMADRPSEADIWKILRAHRSDILAKARRSAG